MDIENLINTQPKKADALARDWTVFASQHPGVSHFQFKQEFVAWANTHGNINTDIWDGKEIQDEYFNQRQKHEEEQVEQTGHVDNHSVPPALAALGFLGMLFPRERPKILEQDPDFKRILDEKANTWLKDHPDKDTTSKEWIDYRYGSPQNPEVKTLYKDAEKEFREKAKENPTYQRRLKVYDEERKKVYDDPTKDPTLIWHQEEIELHTQVRHELLQKTDSLVKIEDVQKQVEASHWERFVEIHPEKSAAYAVKHTGIKDTLARAEERKKQPAAPQITPITIPQTINSIPSAAQPIPPPPTLPRESYSPTPSPSISTARPPQPQYIPNIPRMSSLANIGGTPSMSPATPPSPRGQGARNAQNGLRNRIPGFGGGNPLASLAKNTAIRSAAAIILPILLVSVFTLVIIIGGEATTGEASPLEAGGSSDITQCTLYRGGDPTPGLTFGNPQMATTIQDISTTVEVPASIIAAIMRVETNQAVSTTEVTYLQNDFDNHSSKDDNGNIVAIGVMQFTPETFTSTFASNKADLEKLFGKTDVVSNPQLTTAPNNSSRIFSIKDSIIAAAFKVKADKQSINGDGPWDEQTIRKIAEYYYGKNKDGTTNYPGYNGSIQNYGDDLWKSYQSCQQVQATNGGGSNVSQSAPVPISQAGGQIRDKALAIAKELLYSKPPPDGCVEEKGHGPGFHCWDKPDMIFFNQVSNDTDYLQCTEFVWAAFFRAGFGKEIDLIRNADAAGWPANALKHNNIFSVFYNADASKLLPGDIISVGETGVINGTSHLAIVTNIAPDLSYVTVAQAATDKAYGEKWPIKNGKIDSTQFPLAGRQTRQEVKGFIRLIGKLP